MLLIPILALSQNKETIKRYKQLVKDQRKELKGLEKEESQENGKQMGKMLYAPVWDEFEFFAERGLKELERGMDITLDPIEQISEFPVGARATQGDWGDEYLGLEAEYNRIKGMATRKVRVVVFDTGKPSHTQLEDLMDHSTGKNWSSSATEMDIHSHSSHCLGIVAGADNEAQRDAIADAGSLELAWQKVLSDQGSGSYSSIVKAVQDENITSAKKIQDGVFVIYSFSLGGGSTYAPLEAVFQEALDLGVIIMASAGNSNSSVGYPGNSFLTNAISALQKSGSSVIRSDFSSFGPEVFIATPGSTIYSTLPNNQYGYKSGTSMSNPYAVRIVATLASINPTATARMIEYHLEKHSTELPPDGFDQWYGYGWPVIDKLIDAKMSDNPPLKSPFPGDPPPTKLDPPTLLDPVNGANLSDTTLTFKWGSVTGAARYTITIEDVNSSYNRAANINATSWRITLPKASYRWRVRSQLGDLLSDWSGYFTFAISDDPPVAEICDNGIDDDGDGLIDCDDPDCDSFAGCKNPPVVKPLRDYVATYPIGNSPYTTSYKANNDPKRHTVHYNITVKGESTELMDIYADKLQAVMDKYARGRSYGLVENSDMWDAVKWISYFTDLILHLNDEGEIEQVGIEATVDGRYIRLTEKDLIQYKSRTNNFFQSIFKRGLKATRDINRSSWD